MIDYISRQAAIEALGDEPEVWQDTQEEHAYRLQYFIDLAAIKAIPPADVRPVVRGRWVINNGRWCCDKCTCQAVVIRSPFCSNCGADMREDNDE